MPRAASLGGKTPGMILSFTGMAIHDEIGRFRFDWEDGFHK